MKKILYIILVLCFLLPAISHGEIIYPVSSKNEIQDLVRYLNNQNIKVAEWYVDGRDEGVFEEIGYVGRGGGFIIDGAGNRSFKLFVVDINNDGEDEYVVTYTAGPARYFDIEKVYKIKNGIVEDVYETLKPTISELVKNSNGHVSTSGFQYGDMIVEKIDGKVFFSIVTSKEYWQAWNEGHGDWIDGVSPQAYRFYWDKNNLELTNISKRPLKKSDFVADKTEKK